MDEGEVYFLKQMIKNREAGIEVEGITNFHIGQKVTWTHSEKDEETKKVVETKYTGTVVGISMANVKVEEDEGKVRWTLLPKALKAVVTT
jgi:GTP-sensing pleiotropic transcriptional regulator CodY